MTDTRPLAALHVAVALFGLAGLFGKWIAWNPEAIALARTLVAALTLALFLVLRGERLPQPTRALFGNGALLALHWFAFFSAIEVSTVATGLLGFASFPLFVLIFERVLLGRHWRGMDVVTAILVVGGIAVLVPMPSFHDITVQGLAWGIASGLAFAWLTVRQRRQRQDRSAVALMLWQQAFAALCLAPLVAWQGLGGSMSPEVLAQVLVLGVVCTALAHTLFVYSLGSLTAYRAGVAAALEPAYGIAFAALLLGESPDARTFAGAALLLLAAAVAAPRGPGAGPG